MIIKRIKKILKYVEYEKLLYTKELKKNYEGCSVTGYTLVGKKVFITGATGGIGIALAKRFLLEGCYVTISGRDEKKLKNIEIKMKEEGLELINYCVIDLTDDNNNISDALKKYNIDSMDILINNAGVFTNVDKEKRFRNVSLEEYNKVVLTNVQGAQFLTDSVIENIADFRTNGNVIFISSLCAETNKYKYTPYGISKNAMIGYARYLKEKYDELIVHTILPGSVATTMAGIKENDNISRKTGVLNRLSLPEEVAAFVAFLCSDIGKDISIDGTPINCSACEEL